MDIEVMIFIRTNKKKLFPCCPPFIPLSQSTSWSESVHLLARCKATPRVTQGSEITEPVKKSVYLEQDVVTKLPVPFEEVKQKQEVILFRQANRLWVKN